MPPPFADTRHSGLWQLDCGAADAPYLVFPIASDPVGAGYVDSLPRPGGNATGFMSYEYSMGGKWLELLKQIAPGVTRAAVLRDPNNASGIGQFAVIQAMAPPLGMEVRPINVRDGDGRTPLIIAAAGNMVDVARVLLARGADVTLADRLDRTALMYASMVNREAMAALFKEMKK